VTQARLRADEVGGPEATLSWARLESQACIGWTERSTLLSSGASTGQEMIGHCHRCVQPQLLTSLAQVTVFLDQSMCAYIPHVPPRRIIRRANTFASSRVCSRLELATTTRRVASDAVGWRTIIRLADSCPSSPRPIP
jgi:hypothetical protein